ncbi:MAG: OsmC family peroxiredoxin [Bacteroidetes bacterium]|jgi:uncharacterized OsmC-like protein|nr:OsmC family peroxiredoxin [Bacteroidota bacterium]
MDSKDLRELQSPLKKEYRDHPEAALVTLKASGKLEDGISCKIETGQAMVKAGLHPATGGSGMAVCSGDMLLEALVSCAGVTMNAVATAIDCPLNDAKITAEGDLDFRGTLGVSKEAPVGFKEIRLHFELETDASEDQISSLLKLTERYCVVYQTLISKPTITITHNK